MMTPGEFRLFVEYARKVNIEVAFKTLVFSRHLVKRC